MISVALPILLLLALQPGPADVPLSPTPAILPPQTVPQLQPAPESPAIAVRKIGGSVLAPKVLYSVEPKFTKEARKRKFGGVTIIRLIVDEQGNPVDIHLLHPLADKADKKHHDAAVSLDQAALDAVSQYRFSPATENGKAVPVEINVEVNFRIF